MRQYHIVSAVLVAVAFLVLLLWQAGVPSLDNLTNTDQVVGVERFGGDPQESIRALCLASGERVLAGDKSLRRELEAGTRTIIVRTARGNVKVIIVDGRTGPYFRTVGDGIEENNLLALPNC